MKKLLSIALATAVLSIATTSFAAIVGGKHDFGSAAWKTQYGGANACNVCHGVHKARTDMIVPLWIHDATAQTFTPYTSDTLNAVPGQLGNASKACMSCHDGTVAINAFGKTPGTIVDATGTLGSVFATKLIGTKDLTVDIMDREHPVSFTYDTALATADGALNDPATALGVGGKTIANSMLYGNKMECASCHDPHQVKGTSSTSSKMTVASGHALCLICHIK